MRKFLLTFLLAAIVGLIGGIQGSAGSVYILAGLLAFKIVKTQKEAAGITLFYTSVPLTLAAAYEYYIKGTIDFTIVAILIPTALLFSFFGANFGVLLMKRFSLYFDSFLLWVKYYLPCSTST